jgi:hypothetical protein
MPGTLSEHMPDFHKVKAVRSSPYHFAEHRESFRGKKFAPYGLSWIYQFCHQPQNLTMKNTNQAEEHVATEDFVYRALIVAAGGQPQVADTQAQPAPSKPPVSVGAYRLRRRLRQIDH